MAPTPSQVTRRIGMTLFLAFLGLVLVGLVIREPWPNDLRFFLARWPVWVFAAVGVPFVLLRLVMWHRTWRRQRRVAREDEQGLP